MNTVSEKNQNSVSNSNGFTKVFKESFGPTQKCLEKIIDIGTIKGVAIAPSPLTLILFIFCIPVAIAGATYSLSKATYSSFKELSSSFGKAVVSSFNKLKAKISSKKNVSNGLSQEGQNLNTSTVPQVSTVVESSIGMMPPATQISHSPCFGTTTGTTASVNQPSQSFCRII